MCADTNTPTQWGHEHAKHTCGDPDTDQPRRHVTCYRDPSKERIRRLSREGVPSATVDLYHKGQQFRRLRSFKGCRMLGNNEIKRRPYGYQSFRQKNLTDADLKSHNNQVAASFLGEGQGPEIIHQWTRARKEYQYCYTYVAIPSRADHRCLVKFKREICLNKMLRSDTIECTRSRHGSGASCSTHPNRSFSDIYFSICLSWSSNYPEILYQIQCTLRTPRPALHKWASLKGSFGSKKEKFFDLLYPTARDFQNNYK